jgi:hypothetical protein
MKSVEMDHAQDRRTFPRFRVKDGTLAINQTILGPVVDISLGGMAFEYYGNDLSDNEYENMGFYFIDSEFLLTGIRSKTIKDTVIEPNSGIMPIIRKRRSIQFIELTTEQRETIKRFINQNTTTRV